ncbi:hypothetical protein DPEC_G00216120 [Dallia pectoralis]|uniref:Uncharacterized protein n=1 Tax=Dallia pectoralis TaxID=75939 RepID=A0ACC2G2M3_DALPE|nr:hypothetical protein DPEC_G00216120 [Dallia pectoralis]
MEVSMENKRKDAGSIPTTPSKIPVGKKSKTDNKEAQVSNLTILEAIQSMEKNFDKQLTQLKEQAKQSSCMIASLTKAVQFHAEEVKVCKKKINDLESQSELLEKENRELKERVREQERYKMRWCLKLKGIKEKNEENIRTDIIHLFAKIAPDIDMRQLEDAVDIVHRIGRKEDNKNRHVVILFARRLVREEIWRRSKDSPVCKERGVRFTEMLPLEDREARKNLWPQIEQARREGKRAYYRGPHGYIEGRRIG